MSKRVLDHDPLTGITTFHHYDHSTKQTHIERVQDVQPRLDNNKKLFNDDSYRSNGMKTGWLHAAHIPDIVIEKWLREDGVDVFNPDHMAAVKRKLNSPDWRYLRTSSGRL
jgi:hypothetical protein